MHEDHNSQKKNDGDDGDDDVDDDTDDDVAVAEEITFP